MTSWFILSPRSPIFWISSGCCGYEKIELFCKLEICAFHRSQVAFYSYIMSAERFSMDPQKVSAVLQWLRPSYLCSVQRFLGFANYYQKFIRNFSTLAKPLTDLTRKACGPHDWLAEAIKAFEALKSAFASALMLSHPNPGLPFVLEIMHPSWE